MFSAICFCTYKCARNSRLNCGLFRNVDNRDLTRTQNIVDYSNTSVGTVYMYIIVSLSLVASLQLLTHVLEQKGDVHASGVRYYLDNINYKVIIR